MPFVLVKRLAANRREWRPMPSQPGQPQWPQVAQLPPAQEAQPPPLWLPVTRRLLSPLLLLMAAKVDIWRCALKLAQRGQEMGLLDSRMGRSASKQVWQSVHLYS